ncbi:non-specific serine/threonine protein kinase [Salvia divinorum]|uniref:Non-specific serine/threonine protein kinase n=1 Tax=Salvia divinorum TaxID=28513 RepID=A0ABD1GCZ9_SALDI
MSRVVALLELALEQQERRKGTATQKLQQFWPFWKRVIPSGSTSNDQNEVEVDKLSKAIPATAMKEDDVPFIEFEKGNDIDDATITRLDYMPEHEFEFRAKVSKPLSRLKHENVLELVVYNLDGLQRVLAYNFAPRGSLHDILHGQQGIGSSSEPYPALTWSQRIQIALGVARGLLYLHENEITHHFVNSRNVLLCDDGTAKIIDPFHWIQCNSMYDFSANISHPKLVDNPLKRDVYNFGEILLELLTGSNVTGLQERLRHVSWALPQLDSDKVHKIVDARLKAPYLPEAVKMMARVAKLCLRDNAYSRPYTGKVVRGLKLCLRETKSRNSQRAEIN